MGRSVIHVQPASLLSILPYLVNAVKIERSIFSVDTVALEITGECVPDAPVVAGNMIREVGPSGAIFTMTFVPEPVAQDNFPSVIEPRLDG